MRNNFTYAPEIPERVRDKLIERESLCEQAVFEISPLVWATKTVDAKRTLYVLTKKGLVDFCLAHFSESEILNLSDESFRERIFIQDVEDQRGREKEYVKQRVDDWIARLSELFSRIQSWVPDDCEFMHGTITQRNEELLHRYDIAPREVPTLTVLRGRHRLSFVPSALWVIGADGRVNVTTNTKQYILVDRREDPPSQSCWRIVLGDRENQTVTFSADVVKELLGPNS